MGFCARRWALGHEVKAIDGPVEEELRVVFPVSAVPKPVRLYAVVNSNTIGILCIQLLYLQLPVVRTSLSLWFR